MANNYILHYEKSVYEGRINVLNRDLEKLKEHVENLEGYSTKLRTVWNDDSGTAERYSSLITKMKIDLINQINSLERLRDIYKETIGEVDNRVVLTEGLLDSATGLANTLPTMKGK